VRRVARGTLITIEGLDGAGKTTLARSLARELAAAGTRVQLLREPGGVAVSERIRSLVKDASLSVLPRAEALLYAAARAQLVDERVLPLLEAGTVVLLDRFVDSSLAYQGAGRGLGVERVRAINAFATGGLRADRTLLLRVAPAVGRARRLAREQPETAAAEPATAASDDPASAASDDVPAADAPAGESPLRDRVEREGEEFFARIASAYEQLAREEPERIRVLDAAQPREDVLRDALLALGEPPLAGVAHG